MTTSNYMPDVQVEIAWDSGYTTPAASRTWTDVSEYVELANGMGITVGRQDERSTADANQLTLTLDNSDGRFTAFRAASPYYPNVKIGRPIRVTATPPGGTASTRFVGFVNKWPTEWEGTDTYARATVTASSRLSRLGLSAKLRSMIEQEILSYSPARYYTLGDSSGSTLASDSSGTTGAAAVIVGSGPAIVFGNATGPAVDGLTAASFAAGEYLAAALSGTVAQALHLTVKIDALPASSAILAQVFIGTGSVALSVDSSGILTAYRPGFVEPPITGPSLNDGLTHDVIVVFDHAAVEAELFVDGVSVGVDNWAVDAAATRLEIGSGFEGTLSHVAFFDENSSTIGSLAVAAMTDVVETGFEGDTTDARLTRILGWGGVPSTEVDAETGVETMTYQQTSGQSVVDALRDVESTEGGVLFDGADGDVKFHNRSHRYLAASVATLNMASQHVEADYAPQLDRSALLNDVEVSNPTTEESARAVDTASADEYGVATGSATSVADSYDPLQQKASWLVASYAEPRIRVPSLTVDVLAHQGLTPSTQTLLGVTVGDLVTVMNQPEQSPFAGGGWLLGEDPLGEIELDTPEGNLFVEGYTERIGPESYSITFNLSPTYPTLNTLVLDDAVRGVLDTGLLAY